MSIEEKLKNLIIERYGSMVNFCKEIGMANSTFATIMKKGIHNANIANIIKICQALGISTDELANDRIIPTSESRLMMYARKLSELELSDQEHVISYIDFLNNRKDDDI